MPGQHAFKRTLRRPLVRARLVAAAHSTDHHGAVRTHGAGLNIPTDGGWSNDREWLNDNGWSVRGTAPNGPHDDTATGADSSDPPDSAGDLIDKAWCRDGADREACFSCVRRQCDKPDKGRGAEKNGFHGPSPRLLLG